MANGKKRQFDIRWIIAGVGLLVVLVAAITINNIKTVDDANKLAGTIDIDNGDEKINWARYETFNVELTGSYEITKAGIYHLTGRVEDGLVEIKVTKEEPVKLILDNVTIKNSSGPAIFCYEADDLVIELLGENYLEDGEIYEANFDEDVKGAIYSKADLTFEGDGTLELVANKEDGIVGKDDLKFKSGTYNITAKDDGIRGKDSVYIVDGDFTINAVADAIKSTNETTSGKGFVLIEKGTFKIKSTEAKGLKATNSLLIYGGEFEIETYDDGIHTNNYIGIVGGDIKINSGDDGTHADKELIVDGGKIDVVKSYEGLEAQKITINGGEISIYAMDDGMNAGGGADGSANNRPGAGMFDVEEDCALTVNGGEIYVNAAGDGVDSNGYIYFNGGKVVVDGPTNNGNGALDTGASIVMTGGEVVAVGASGMAVDLGNSSSIYNISVFFGNTIAKDTEITVKNAAGETVISHTAAKTFSHLAAGSDKFQLGETYTIYLNGEEYDKFTISKILTTVGNNNQNPQNMMRRR